MPCLNAELLLGFCYKNSYEEAVCDLHAQIKAGTLAISNGRFPYTALRHLESM